MIYSPLKGRKMHKNYLLLFLFTIACLFSRVNAAQAEETVKVTATVIVASNEGNDFDLDNDAFRDQLIDLFSYSAYKQLDAHAVELKRHMSVNIDMVDGYVLHLTFQGQENDRVLIQADIRKGGKEYVDTVLAIHSPSAAFLGGPPVSKGTLIIVLETGY